MYGDGSLLGEIEVVPDKMSEAAYSLLRADLERVWIGLTFAPDGPSAVEAGPPPPRELWRRIETVVAQIVRQPHEHLVDVETYRRAQLVRTRRELTPATLRAQQFGGSARVRTLSRTVDTPENRLVADTLHRLVAYARRRGDQETHAAVVGVLGSELFRSVASTGRGERLYVLDQRYRQVQQVRRLLTHPELEPVEGPGEVRLGVQSLPRLFEYWLFLKVLEQAATTYGRPLGAGFSVLRVDTNQRPRIEIPRGATVEFPGDVVVAFEPEIRESSMVSWQGLEYVRHPDPAVVQRLATPDVVVLRRGEEPQALVLDAKYVARGLVELRAAEVHTKYARMRREGTPVVSKVLAVHPHLSFPAMAWAGYGHLACAPGAPVPDFGLPVPRSVTSAPVEVLAPDEASELPDQTLVIHQGWLRDALGHRRLDLGRVLTLWGTGERVAAIVVMPRLGALAGFAHQIERQGWEIAYTDAADFSDVEPTLVEQVRTGLLGGDVVLFCGEETAEAMPHSDRLHLVSDVAELLDVAEFRPSR
ncbi:hypothetical protein [Nocardioides ultimimeridianus]